MIELQINIRFSQLLAPLKSGAYARLASELVEDLTTEPVSYWHNPATNCCEILDGHHRYQIAKEQGIELRTHERFFDTEDEAASWILYNQLIRRNIVNVDEKKRLIAEAVKFARKDGDTSQEAVVKVAESHNVSERSVYRAVAEAEESEPDKVQLAAAAFETRKKDYERSLTKRKEQLFKAFQMECVKDGLAPDESDEERLRERLEKEFETETEALQAEGELIAEMLSEQSRDKQSENQIDGKREKSAFKKNSKGKAKSLLADKKSSLKRFETALSKAQAIYYEMCRYYGNELLVIDSFAVLFDGIEAQKKTIEVKSKFGKKK